jgi:hypothetical protein
MDYAYVDGAFLRERSAYAVSSVLQTAPEFDFAKMRSALRVGRPFYCDCVEDAPRREESPEAFMREQKIKGDFLSA